MKLIKDTQDSISLTRIYDDNYDYSYGYYSNNEWVDDHRLVLVRNPISEDKADKDFIGTSELVLIDINSKIEKVICTAEEYGAISYSFVVHKNKVYYIAKDNGLYCKDIETGEKKLLHMEEKISLPHMTVDGRFLNVTLGPINQEEGTFGCLVFDLESGTVEKVFETRFKKPFPIADNMMLCPTDKDKVFFAHEGITDYISNRLWLWERNRGIRCIAKQRLDENGNLGDCFGHECWAHDGKGIYFVKYPRSTIHPTGICHVGVDGKQTDVLYGKYTYWHVCDSPNGRFLAADTTGADDNQPEYSGVCIINKSTGEEKMLVKADITWKHPCHPHPKFNLDSSKLLFHELYKDRICVNLIEISDIF